MGIYAEKVTLKYDDIGKSNCFNIRSLVKYLGDAASAHASSVGLGLNEIPITHIAWVIVDWKIKMFSHPQYNEEIIIKTWPRVLEKFYSYRDFEVFDNNNNLIAIASSKWIMINSETKKIEKINNTVLSSYEVYKKSVFSEPLDEKPKIPDNLKLNFTYTIQRRDIDTNGHVNNLHYIDYALETLPEEVYYSNVFNNIDIHYKKEIKYGDINCYYCFENNNHIIIIKNKDNSIVHAIIKLN